MNETFDPRVDYYSILGLTPQATADQIKIGYRKRSLSAHPDAGGSHAAFLLVNQAYQFLKDKNVRAAYDAARQPAATATVIRNWQQAAQPAATSAATVTEHFEHDLTGFGAWMQSVMMDFSAASYGQQNEDNYTYPTVEGSKSGKAFIGVGRFIGFAAGLAVALATIDEIARHGWKDLRTLAYAPLYIGLFQWIGACVGKFFHASIRNAVVAHAEKKVVYTCRCGQKLRVPTLEKAISVTCPKCRKRFDVPPVREVPVSQESNCKSDPRDAARRNAAEGSSGSTPLGETLVRRGYTHAEQGQFKLALEAWAEVLDDGFASSDVDLARFHAARAFARFVALGIGCNSNPQGAVDILSSAGYSPAKALAVLGQLCQSNEMPPVGHRNDQAAVYFFQKATIERDPEGMFGLALCYGEGWGIERDADKCMRLLGLAAEAGHVDAMMTLGALMAGSKVAATRAAAIPWLIKAAEGGSQSAMNILAKCYREGVGVNQDQKIAGEWEAYAKAAAS